MLALFDIKGQLIHPKPTVIYSDIKSRPSSGRVRRRGGPSRHKYGILVKSVKFEVIAGKTSSLPTGVLCFRFWLSLLCSSNFPAAHLINAESNNPLHILSEQSSKVF